jgi:magnesium transporter
MQCFACYRVAMSSVPDFALGDAVLDHLKTDYRTVPLAATVGSVLHDLRESGYADEIVYFYVIDPANKLVGVVPTRRLLASYEDVAVRDIMVPNVATIPPTMTMLDAGKRLQQYRYLAMPVTAEDGSMLGTVDLTQFGGDVLISAPHDIQHDVFRLIGVHLSAAASNSPWTGFLDRAPWLGANIVGGMLAAVVVSLYEPFLDTATVLALFIPVVLSLSESVSIQSMTITFQRLNSGEGGGRSLLKEIGRELLSAVMLGLACGGTVGIISYLWKRDILVAGALAGALFLSMITACLIGFVLPWAIHKLKGDPYIASGPIVLPVTDIIALLFYLNLAGILLRGAGTAH